MRQLIEKFGKIIKELHFFFAYLGISREVILKALRKKGVIEPEVITVMETYRRTEARVKLEGDRSFFPLFFAML